jgi:hypothetical protein
VPITLFTFSQHVYNFGSKHCKRSLFDILSNPVPRIEFDGHLGESDEFDLLKCRCFNHKVIARRIAWSKQLSSKSTTRSSVPVDHDCPMAYIDPTTPKLHGYKSYDTFNDTSSEKEVLNSGRSMPMMLYFAICHFSYPKVVHSILPRGPPDEFISSVLISVLVTLIVATMTT